MTCLEFFFGGFRLISDSHHCSMFLDLCNRELLSLQECRQPKCQANEPPANLQGTWVALGISRPPLGNLGQPSGNSCRLSGNPRNPQRSLGGPSGNPRWTLGTPGAPSETQKQSSQHPLVFVFFLLLKYLHRRLCFRLCTCRGEGRLFCFLPLPRSAVSLKLPVHVHAPLNTTQVMCIYSGT